MIRAGVCGWCKAQDEVIEGVSTLEVQKTFYQPPRVSTAERWRTKADEAPGDFAFTVKVWQLVTHPPSSPTYSRTSEEIEDAEAYGYCQPTAEVLDAVERTVEIAETLEAPFLVLQCPPSFEPTDEHLENLEALAEEIDRDALWRLAWEPRDAWEPDQVREICRKLDFVHASDPFAMPSQTPERLYLRLHGRPAEERNYGYSYTDEDLAELVDVCRGADDAWVLFNNHSMFGDAQRFRERAQDAGLDAV